MNEPEFSRVVRAYPQPPETLTITADEAERAALATRFGVAAIGSMTAEVAFETESAGQAKEKLTVKGTIDALGCAVAPRKDQPALAPPMAGTPGSMPSVPAGGVP